MTSAIGSPGDDLRRDPLEIFQAWQNEARGHGDPEPDAMALATSSPDGTPSVRMMLLRGLDTARRQLRFFTNYESRKARELESGLRASVLFHYWVPMHRQVRIDGLVERLTDVLSDEYFASRPRGHQIGAWVSPQSRPIESIESLRSRAGEVARQFEGQAVPRPTNWGGYGLVAERVELWIAGADRLHERYEYRFERGNWRVDRLAP